MIPERDPRRLIARLAVAVMAADGRIASEEIAASEELDLLGLGRLSSLVREEMLIAVEQPIDVVATSSGLAGLGAQTGVIILAVLADVAAGDGALLPREREVLGTVATGLGIAEPDACHIFDAASASSAHQQTGTRWRPRGPEPEARAPIDPGLAAAARQLGIEPGASVERIDAAYLALVERYSPAKVTALGPEFVALTVHKLADLTVAFERLRAASR
jgi:DnaJ-domain-containing protein 1